MNNRLQKFEREAGSLEERLVAGLAKVALASRQELFRAGAESGVSAAQAQVLVHLARDGPATVGDLAAKLAVTVPTVSDSVAALERRKLLAKERDRADARRVLVRATAQGVKLGESLTLWPEFLVDGVSQLSGEEKSALLRAVLILIGSLVDRGVVQRARMCVTCNYFRPWHSPGSARPHYCALADLPLAADALRVDCPEHVVAEPDRGRAARAAFSHRSTP